MRVSNVLQEQLAGVAGPSGSYCVRNTFRLVRASAMERTAKNRQLVICPVQSEGTDVYVLGIGSESRKEAGVDGSVAGDARKTERRRSGFCDRDRPHRPRSERTSTMQACHASRLWIASRTRKAPSPRPPPPPSSSRPHHHHGD
jgi:hypothetical protein